MKRFILLSFGFLGWAFYEMSGGDEFESASSKMARLSPAPQVKVTEVADTVTLNAADTGPKVLDTDPPNTDQVTRVSLNLTTLEEVVKETEETPAPVVADSNIDPESGVAVNPGFSLASADTPAIIPSLIAPAAGAAAGTQTALLSNNPAGDVRQVSGNRVNVRGGPGTDFNVVGKLVRGDAVEIIEDNGDGWVRMRALDSGEEGWLADFLLTSG